MGIEAEETKVIRADSDVIWDLLARPDAWRTWWPGCVAARTLDDRPLGDGSELEVVLQPRVAKKTFHPVVDRFSERKMLSLTHRSSFIQSTAVWYLQEKPDATHVKAEIVFNGLFPFLITIAQQSSVVRGVLQANLRGLKKAAERMA